MGNYCTSDQYIRRLRLILICVEKSWRSTQLSTHIYIYIHTHTLGLSKGHSSFLKKETLEMVLIS